MAESNFISLDTSVLYRANQRYYDEALAAYGIGYAHLIFLIEIYESEGISMNLLADKTFFDKGTVTKSLQKLEELGYVEISVNESDRRMKLLYTSDKAREIILKLYEVRQERWNYLSSDLDAATKDIYTNITSALTKKARDYIASVDDSNQLKLYGFQKCTLLDYPGKLASTLFTGGCNFRCPFCHNKDLVYLKEGDSNIDLDYILNYLQKRQGLLDGVCISGGEPLLAIGLETFIRKLKAIGLKVKLDTNGFYFERLKQLLDEDLLDYVAMDIKNSQAKYAQSVGLSEIDLEPIDKSIKLLLGSKIDYEFRTTVVDEFHQIEDIEAIAKWIKGAKRYTIQNFIDRDSVIQKGLHSIGDQRLSEFKTIAETYVQEALVK